MIKGIFHQVTNIQYFIIIFCNLCIKISRYNPTISYFSNFCIEISLFSQTIKIRYLVFNFCVTFVSDSLLLTRPLKLGIFFSTFQSFFVGFVYLHLNLVFLKKVLILPTISCLYVLGCDLLTSGLVYLNVFNFQI